MRTSVLPYKINVRITAALLLLFLLLAAAGCNPRPEPMEPDPYEGMILVPDGAGGEMWVVLSEVLTPSSFSAEDFTQEDGFISYTGEEYEALRGIDVSEHQNEIDWSAVAGSGVQFAIIRAGYRGYTEGTLKEDLYFRRNMEGAAGAGIKTGVYFFSQAVNVQEAVEEANYLLGLLSGYNVELPVFFDWEPITGVQDVRTDGIGGDVVTECCLAFAQTIESAGYEAGVYFYRSQGYFEYDLDRLSELTFWSAAVGGHPDFYYEHSFWQYTFTGSVPGIEGGVDLDLMFVKKPTETGGESIGEQD